MPQSWLFCLQVSSHTLKPRVDSPSSCCTRARVTATGGVTPMERFQARARAKSRGRTAVILGIAVLCVGLFELYRILIPFDSMNPLWSEVTIGQVVLGNWRYGGEDAEGYLKFYNASQTVLLPPNAHLFGAGGRFVVLEQHSPTSLTYALPRNAIPVSWLAAGAGLAAVPIGLLLLRFKRVRSHFNVRRSIGIAGFRGRARLPRSNPARKFSSSKRRKFLVHKPSLQRGFRSFRKK